MRMRFVFFCSVFFIAISIAFSFNYSTSSFAYSTNMSASVVVGQQNFVSNSANQGGTANANTLKYVGDVLVVGQKLIVSDYSNNRVLIYNSIPTSANASANVVIGQQNFTNTSANQGGSAGANTLNFPGNIASDGTRLFIADSNNNRVLVYNSIPTSNNASADVVIGQPDKTTVTGGTTRSKIDYTWGVNYDASTGKLFISDSGNNRVLIYNSIPAIDGALADTVIGQSDFVTGTSGITSNKLSSPYGAIVVSNKLVLVDNGNNRVLIYNTVPSSPGATANVVIGQQDMTSRTSNQGGSVSSNTLSFPTDVASSGTNLFLQDAGNSRVLVFNSLPTADNTSANSVIGQPDFSTASSPGNPSDKTLYDDEGGLAVTSSQLIVGDSSNYRVVIYNDDTPLPTATPTNVGSANSSSSNFDNPNHHTGWAHDVMAGPGFIGERKFITNSAYSGVATYIGPGSTNNDIFVQISAISPFDLSSRSRIPFPWSQGFNTVGDIFEFNAVSAFNSYGTNTFLSPVTIQVPYEPNRVSLLPLSKLRIVYYDGTSHHWKSIPKHTVVNANQYTLANTTKTFSYFVAGYAK